MSQRPLSTAERQTLERQFEAYRLMQSQFLGRETDALSPYEMAELVDHWRAELRTTLTLDSIALIVGCIIGEFVEAKGRGTLLMDEDQGMVLRLVSGAMVDVVAAAGSVVDAEGGPGLLRQLKGLLDGESPAAQGAPKVDELGPAELEDLAAAVRGFAALCDQHLDEQDMIGPVPARIDLILARWRSDPAIATQTQVVQGAGATLGQFFVDHHGGRWVAEGHGEDLSIAVRSRAGGLIHPFDAVIKRLDTADPQAIASLVVAIIHAERKAGAAGKPAN